LYCKQASHTRIIIPLIKDPRTQLRSEKVSTKKKKRRGKIPRWQEKMSCCLNIQKKKGRKWKQTQRQKSTQCPQLIVKTFSLPTNGVLSYKFPSDVRSAFVQVQGAGGSGSIPFNQDVDIFTAGAGGGAGGYTEANVLIERNQIYDITVGRGGSAISSSGDGNAGSASSFQTRNGEIMLLAQGGGGGSASGDRLGGAGGSASGGSQNSPGETGQPGLGPPGFVQVGRTGAGGGSAMGQGGFSAAFSTVTFGGVLPGQSGVLAGAGGGAGGAIFASETFFGNSGAGADGQVQLSFTTRYVF
jgi:hypothetical protein